MLTIHEDEGYFREALRFGALGYIPKKAAESELISAIRAVHRGELLLCPSLTKDLVKELIYGTVFDKDVEVKPVWPSRACPLCPPAGLAD